MPRDLTPRLRMIIDAPKVIAVRHRCEGAVEGQDLEPMTREIEFANNLRAQKRDDVGANRKFETGKDFLRHRGAAKHVPALEHQHALAGAREICSVDQAVVAAANYNDVIFLGHHVAQVVNLRALSHETVAFSALNPTAEQFSAEMQRTQSLR